MYAYLCINILWVAGDEFFLFSLAPSPEPEWPCVSSWDLLPWDFKLQHKVRILFSTSTPFIERLPVVAQKQHSERTHRWEQSKGKERRETFFWHLLSLLLEHWVYKRSIIPATPRGEEAGPSLFMVNWCGYHEITTQFMSLLFNLL